MQYEAWCSCRRASAFHIQGLIFKDLTAALQLAPQIAHPHLFS
jgi:hypothetical protein